MVNSNFKVLEKFIFSKPSLIQPLLSILVVERVLLRNFSIISQDQSFIHFLYIFVMNYELLGWANRLGEWVGQRVGLLG